jgi:hypothetical protein
MLQGQTPNPAKSFKRRAKIRTCLIDEGSIFTAVFPLSCPTLFSVWPETPVFLERFGARTSPDQP